MRTALNASRLAIAAFLVPYVFALNPAMLFIDTVWYEVVLIAVSSFIGMISISVALEGYLIHEVNPLGRILLRCRRSGTAHPGHPVRPGWSGGSGHRAGSSDHREQAPEKQGERRVKKRVVCLGLTLLLLLNAALVTALGNQGWYLVLRSADTGQTYGRYPMAEGGWFSVGFVHSVNKSP